MIPISEHDLTISEFNENLTYEKMRSRNEMNETMNIHIEHLLNCHSTYVHVDFDRI